LKFRETALRGAGTTLFPSCRLYEPKPHYKHLDFSDRYPISYKIAKKANPENEICPYSKMKASLNAVISSNFSSYINL
jgi:hypothetical protein